MKRIISCFTAAALAFALAAPALAAGGFEKVNTYTPGQFTDVPEDLWCADNVRTAYEYGIMSGKSATRFDTASSLTVAQTIVMACRLHSGYTGDGAEFASAAPWYQSYLDYAAENGIVWEFDSYDVPVTRADFAVIAGSALPDEALPVISDIEDGAIPDVPEDADYAEAVYRLYGAGVLTGNDAYGTFTPDSYITRGAAAALVSRMADPSLRKAVTLEKDPFRPTPAAQLQNLASLKKSCTDAEFQAAYDAALAVVEPLADLGREEQLFGVALALRSMVESGKVTYTTSMPHYNDPYGYFVAGVSSCAGCTRATGLCLNMLGIPYEHVNENQWDHQWCRVPMEDGSYWICDAYGLYCGPEPAPYQHPYL